MRCPGSADHGSGMNPEKADDEVIMRLAEEGMEEEMMGTRAITALVRVRMDDGGGVSISLPKILRD